MDVFAIVICRTPEDPDLAKERPREYYMGNNRWTILPHNAELLSNDLAIENLFRSMSRDQFYWMTNKPLLGQSIPTKFSLIKLGEIK